MARTTTEQNPAMTRTHSPDQMQRATEPTWMHNSDGITCALMRTRRATSETPTSAQYRKYLGLQTVTSHP
jgi:hypothetical protein